jgi:hypothetical protein
MFCLHCWHKTGRKGKKLKINHKKYGKTYYLLLEKECCKCGKRKWFAESIDAEYGGKIVYTEEQIKQVLL